MKDILILLDGATEPSPEVRLGRHFQKLFRGRVVLAVLTPRETGKPSGEAQLQEIIADPAYSDFEFEKVRLKGGRSQAIINETIRGEYSIVIFSPWLARRHENIFSDTVLNRVLHQSPCSLAIPKGEGGDLHRILICDSGSEDQPILDRFTAQMAELITPQVEITVLHVMSQMTAYPGVRGSQLRAEAEELIGEHSPEGIVLEHDLDVLDRAKTRPRAKVRHGLVVDEILQESVDGEYDLIVIGAHRGEGWQRFLLQDIAQDIVAGSQKPILLLP